MNNLSLKLILKSTILVFILVILDQITKIKVVDYLIDNNRLVLIDGVLEFIYVKNTGAAFSFLTGFPIVFIITTPIVVLIILYYYSKIPNEKKYFVLRILFLFLISGAIGNFIDRVSLGFVRDFIYFSLINFPVFNVADIYVTCSVIIFIILAVFYYDSKELDSIFFGDKSSNEDKTKE